MAQTHAGAMRVLATKAGVSVEELTDRHAAGEKWCYRCRRWREHGAYVRDRSRYDGLSSACVDCRSTRTAPGPSIRERRLRRANGEAWCRGCSKWLPCADVAQGLCRVHRAAEERARYHTDQTHQRSRRHRSAQRKRGVAPIPAIAQECLTEAFDGLCAFCDRKATTYDHLVPVSKGGQTEPRFVVPCCRSCNSSKKDRDMEEWLTEQGRPIKDELVNILVMQDCWPV